MALSDEELLLLDCFMYSDIAPNCVGMDLADVIDMFVDPKTNKVSAERLEYIGSPRTKIHYSGSTDAVKMANVLERIREKQDLMNLKITHSTVEKRGGIRAACFIDKTTNKATVAFRGTGGSFNQWYTNFEGYGDYITQTQKDAVAFIESLPYEGLTVTGHSNGGGQAMFVTIECEDKVERCVSYEGQGLSRAYVDENQAKIERNRGKITNIAASNDPVNTLMISVAGTVHYVTGNDFFSHGAYVLYSKNHFNDDGTFTAGSYTEQSPFYKALHEITVQLDNIYEVPFAGDVMEFIADTLGVGAGLIFSTISDGISWDNFNDALERLKKSYNELVGDLTKSAIEAITAGINFVHDFINNTINWYNKNLNIGYRYASANPDIKVDTNLLEAYAGRLSAINKRMASIDSRMDRLYRRLIRIEDFFFIAGRLWNLMQADIMTSYSWRLNRCSSYLRETAENFSDAERKIMDKMRE